MKKILLFLLLFLPLKLFAQDVIVIDPGTFQGGIMNIDPWLSLDPLLDSVQNWIWVNKDNQTGRETGTYMLPYNTIPEGVADIVDGSMMIIVTPIDGSSYDITDPIVIGYDNVVVTGQGSSTIIDGDGLATGEHAFSITGKTGCVIQNLSIQTEDGGGKTSHCIFLDNGADGTVIRNVAILDSDSDGIHIEGTNITDVTIQNCNILDVDDNGISVDMDAANTMIRMNIINNIVQSAGSVGITIRDYQYGNCNVNTVSASTSHGILMALGVSNTVDDNVVTGNGGEGIQLNGSTDNTVSGNTLTGNTNCGIEFTGSAHRNTASGNTCRTNQYGIYFESSDYCTASGNVTEGNSASGIFVDNSPYASITGNTSTNDDSAEGGGGIVVMDCDHVTVIGNTSSASTYNGLYLYNADYCTVTGNIFSANTIDGIYLSDAATYNIISSNECYGNTGDGIELAAGAETGNIVLSNKLLGNGESALEDNGTGTMLMHDNTATMWYLAPDVKVEDTLFLGNDEYFENETNGEIHTNASFEPETHISHDLGGPGSYWHGTYTDDLYVSDSAHIDTLVSNYAVIDSLIINDFIIPDDSLGAYIGTEDLPFSHIFADSIFAEHLELGTLDVDSIDAEYINTDTLIVNDTLYVAGKSMFDSTVSIGEWGYSLNHIIIPESSSNTNAGLGMYGMVDYSATAGKVFAGTYSRMLAMTTNQTNQSTMVGTESQFRLRDVDIADGVHAGLWAYAEQSGESTLSGGGTFDAISATVESGEHFTVGATEQVTGLTVDASIHASATIDASANYSGIYIKSNGLDWFDGIKITGVDNDLKLHSGNTINNPSADDIIYTGRLGSSYFQSLTDIATLDRQHILSGTGKMTGSDPFNGKDQMQGGFFAMQLGEGDAITDARSLYGSESKATLDRDMSDATSNLIGAFNKISVRKTTTFAGTAIANKTILERANTATIAQGYNYYAEKSAVGFTSSAIMGTRADTWDYGIDFNAATFGTSDFRLHNGATINNTSADLLTITEATTDVVNAFTAGSVASDAGLSGVDLDLSGDIYLDATKKVIFADDADDHTYILESGADILDVYVGGVIAASFKEATTTQLLVGDGTAALPSLSFISDPNYGFYMDGTVLKFTANGTDAVQLTSAGAYRGNVGGSWALINVDATATVPAITLQGDGNTGIGSAGADQLSLIAGGKEGIRIDGAVGGIEIYMTDTTIFDNGAYISNEETDTLKITETVTKIEGNLVVTGDVEFILDHAYMGFVDSTTTLAITQDQWAQVTNAYDSLFIVVHEYGVEYVLGDSLQITKAGTYSISGELSLQGSNNENWKVAARRTRSGSTTTIGFPVLKYTGVANTVAVPFDCLATDLEVDDLITLEIMNTTDNDDCVVKGCNFIITYFHNGE